MIQGIQTASDVYATQARSSLRKSLITEEVCIFNICKSFLFLNAGSDCLCVFKTFCGLVQRRTNFKERSLDPTHKDKMSYLNIKIV